MRAYLIAFSSIAALAAASPAAAEGFRAEIHGGWDHSEVADEGDSGVLYGIGVGYDFKLGEKTTLGIEANLDDSTQKECETVAGDRYCLRAGRDISAAVRLGYNVSEAGMIYGLAGYTNARFKATIDDGTDRDSDATNLDGFRLGAGYQHKLGSNLYGKVEYRYSNYENGVDRHQALMGVGINF
jgi:outer membrane immunogenic protein